MVTKLFENKNLTIVHHKDDEYLLLTWSGFLSSEEFRNAGKEIIRAIEKTNVRSVLSDNTNWKIISPNDHGWAAYNWFPEAESKGVRKLATVLSHDYFNRYAVRSIENMAEVDCMEIRNFDNADQALHWLTTSRVPACG